MTDVLLTIAVVIVVVVVSIVGFVVVTAGLIDRDQERSDGKGTTTKIDDRPYHLYVDGLFRRAFSSMAIARFWAMQNQTEYGADSWRIEKDGLVLDRWEKEETS